MSEQLILRISVSPQSLQRLNRGETVSWEGVAHPHLTIELTPIDGAGVPAPEKAKVEEAAK